MFAAARSLLAAALVTAVPAARAVHAPWDVVHKKVAMPGLIAGGDKDALLYYPAMAATAPNSSLPFLSFAHGMATNAEQYDDLLTKVAAAGFIILAPRTCPLLFCGDDFSKDQLHAITYAQEAGTALDPVIAKVDFKRIGIFGHSMGGAATLMSSANATANGIQAAFALNPACDAGRPNCRSSHITIPVFFATADEDVIVLPAFVEMEFGHDPVEDKVLVQLKDAGHMEVVEKNNRWEGWVVDYLNCKIAGAAAACDTVYNKTSGICSHVKASKCKLPATPNATLA